MACCQGNSPNLPLYLTRSLPPFSLIVTPTDAVRCTASTTFSLATDTDCLSQPHPPFSSFSLSLSRACPLSLSLQGKIEVTHDSVSLLLCDMEAEEEVDTNVSHIPIHNIVEMTVPEEGLCCEIKFSNDLISGNFEHALEKAS